MKLRVRIGRKVSALTPAPGGFIGILEQLFVDGEPERLGYFIHTNELVVHAPQLISLGQPTVQLGTSAAFSTFRPKLWPQVDQSFRDCETFLIFLLTF